MDYGQDGQDGELDAIPFGVEGLGFELPRAAPRRNPGLWGGSPLGFGRGAGMVMDARAH